ncbi:MAG: transcriptional repressor [Actinomycetota bacterium]|nr:transcriptional repressor [Actinomycetota bacterium]
MTELLDRLRQRAWRLTAQRRVVAEVLAGEHVHLTAEAVHGRARVLLPEISLATVYNTLNELVAMGEVRAVQAGDGSRRYDPNVAPGHQHLQCVRCGALWDVEPTGGAALVLPVDQQRGFRLLDVDILFRGLCPDCNSGPV